MIVICSSRKWLTKNDKVNFGIIPKTNEELLYVTYGCIRFIKVIDFFDEFRWIF